MEVLCVGHMSTKISTNVRSGEILKASMEIFEETMY